MSAVSWRSQKIKEGTIAWHDISASNLVVNVDWKELVTGMNRNRREWWKVKTSRYYGISQSSVIGKSSQEIVIVFIDKKKKEVVIIDAAIPDDDSVKHKELEKIEKY